MVKHIIIWSLKDDFSRDEKEKIKSEAKWALEALNGNIDGLLDIKLITDLLDSSNGEMMLDSTFESREALNNYQKHPLHMAAADAFVRPFSAVRLCVDYEA